jgi:hypothetical protein
MVKVCGYGYRVELEKHIPHRYHTVSAEGVCQCKDGGSCLAVLAVFIYLRSGGERAILYPDDYFPSLPKQCPICNAECSLRSVKRDWHGVVWRCNANPLHYWEARWNAKNRVRDIVGDKCMEVPHPERNHESIGRFFGEAPVSPYKPDLGKSTPDSPPPAKAGAFTRESGKHLRPSPSAGVLKNGCISTPPFRGR